MKKWIVLILSFVLCAGLLAGCQSKAEPDAQDKAADVQEEMEEADVYVFIAASLKNSMEEIKTMYEADHPEVNIIYNADSSGTLQTQIEEGAQCDIFFSAATKQMDALNEGGHIESDSVVNLLENKIVLIKAAKADTAVTGFDNITNAANLALAGEDVPVGQYSRKLFEKMGITDQVMAMEINEGANVTAVLTAVAEMSNEVGIVYATDAASMPDDVEIIAEAAADQVDPAIYPIGLVKDNQATEGAKTAAKELYTYLTTSEDVMKVLTDAGFVAYKE